MKRICILIFSEDRLSASSRKKINHFLQEIEGIFTDPKMMAQRIFRVPMLLIFESLFLRNEYILQNFEGWYLPDAVSNSKLI